MKFSKNKLSKSTKIAQNFKIKLLKEVRMYRNYNQFYQTIPDTYEDIYDDITEKCYSPSSDEENNFKYNHPLIRNKFKNTTFIHDDFSSNNSNFSGYLSSEYNLYERKLIKSKTVSFSENLSTCINDKTTTKSNGSIKIRHLLHRKAGRSILKRPSTFFVERLGNDMVTDRLAFGLQNKTSFFDKILDGNEMLKKAKTALEPLNFSLF